MQSFLSYVHKMIFWFFAKINKSFAIFNIVIFISLLKYFQADSWKVPWTRGTVKLVESLDRKFITGFATSRRTHNGQVVSCNALYVVFKRCHSLRSWTGSQPIYPTKFVAAFWIRWRRFTKYNGCGSNIQYHCNLFLIAPRTQQYACEV